MTGADVIVLGGGVVGLTVAWLLAERGAAVMLLDATAPGSGASGAAQGELVPPGPDLEPAFRRSLLLYARLAAQSGMPWDDEPVGTLLLSVPDGRGGPVPARAVVGAERVPRHALVELEPAVGPCVDSGLLLGEGRRIEPAAVVAALVRAARCAGARLHAGVGRTRLEPEPGGSWSVVTASGARRTARRVVVAAGMGSAALLAPLGIHVPLVGVRGRVLVTEPVAPVLRHVLAEEVIGAPRSVALLAHQTPAGRLVLGGSWYPQDEAEPADLTERIRARAQLVLPGIGRPRVVAERSGSRPALPDRRPVVDRLGAGLYGCFGHGGEGFIAGPGTAALLADVLAGASEPDPAFAARRWTTTLRDRGDTP